MKIKSLFYPLAIAAVALTSSCSRSESGYVQNVCQYPVKQYQHIYTVRENDTYWGLYSLKDWESVVVKYTGKAFTDLCVVEKNSAKVSVKGRFIDVKAYMKMTDKDSVEVPIVKTVLDATNNIYSFEGSVDGIDLKPFYQHYTGRMYPVLYITMPFDSPYKDYAYMIERLKFNLISIEIEPTSKTL